MSLVNKQYLTLCTECGRWWEAVELTEDTFDMVTFPCTRTKASSSVLYGLLRAGRFDCMGGQPVTYYRGQVLMQSRSVVAGSLMWWTRVWGSGTLQLCRWEKICCILPSGDTCRTTGTPSQCVSASTSRRRRWHQDCGRRWMDQSGCPQLSARLKV